MSPGATVSEQDDVNLDAAVTAATLDQDAPWGRKADGTPKAKPGRPASGDASATGTRRVSAPKTGGARKSRTSVDYRPGIIGMFNMVALPLAFSAPADAAAVSAHAPVIADALNVLAAERPEVAAVLDRILQVGPYGAVFSAVLPLAIQIMVNHGVMSAGPFAAVGVISKEEILISLRAA